MFYRNWIFLYLLHALSYKRQCCVFRNGFREGTVAKKRVTGQGASATAAAK